jgi:hypothetical protein
MTTVWICTQPCHPSALDHARSYLSDRCLRIKSTEYLGSCHNSPQLLYDQQKRRSQEQLSFEDFGYHVTAV